MLRHQYKILLVQEGEDEFSMTIDLVALIVATFP